jgi:hypothetical protein
MCLVAGYQLALESDNKGRIPEAQEHEDESVGSSDSEIRTFECLQIMVTQEPTVSPSRPAPNNLLLMVISGGEISNYYLLASSA